MTADTSRAAVEALITEWHNSKGKSGYTGRGDRLADAAAALLDERDRLAANRDAWVSDAMTSTTELEQRIRDLEAERDGLEDSLSARDVELQQRALRIRDLEVTNRKISERSANHHDNAIRWRERAERAEAERDVYKRAKAENDERFQIEAAEQRERADRLAAKLDAVRAALYASDYEPTNRIWHEQMQRLRAILADTDEPKDSITFNTDDLGPATDIDGNPLADTDERNER